GAIQEERARQNGCDGLTDTFIERCALTALRIEAQQQLHVGLRNRAPVGLTRELLEDASGARGLLGSSLRMTDEDLLAARRVAEPGRVVGAADLEIRQAQHAVLSAAGHLRIQLVVRLRKVPMQEGH